MSPDTIIDRARASEPLQLRDFVGPLEPLTKSELSKLAKTGCSGCHGSGTGAQGAVCRCVLKRCSREGDYAMAEGVLCRRIPDATLAVPLTSSAGR